MRMSRGRWIRLALGSPVSSQVSIINALHVVRCACLIEFGLLGSMKHCSEPAWLSNLCVCHFCAWLLSDWRWIRWALCGPVLSQVSRTDSWHDVYYACLIGFGFDWLCEVQSWAKSSVSALACCKNVLVWLIAWLALYSLVGPQLRVYACVMLCICAVWLMLDSTGSVKPSLEPSWQHKLAMSRQSA